jgi:peptide/nickel transport system permease protein
LTSRGHDLSNRETSPDVKSAIRSVKAEKWRLRLTKMNKTIRAFKKSRMGMLGLAILLIFGMMAILAEPLYDLGIIDNPNKVTESSNYTRALKPPSSDHLLGTDEKGRDVFSEIFFGSRNSLIVGFAAALITMVMGAGIGLLAGTYGRSVDEFLMRTTDLFLVIPWLPFAVILATFLPPENKPSLFKIIVVIGITSWPATARIVRAQVLSIRERSFVERAVAIGSGKLHIMGTHLLPNVFPLVFANAILSVSYAILSEAFLSFFGLSDVTKITWGLMLYNSFNFGGFANEAYWFVLPPGICIIIVVLGFTFVSYALDEIMNPRLRRR